MALALFPYPPRAHQEAIVSGMAEALLAGGHAVVESGTGTGKTVCALTAAVGAARARSKRVLYLTRTNAQERQVVVEYRRVRARGEAKGTVVALQGRTHMCPLRATDREMAAANSEELGVMCRDRCRAADRAKAGEPTAGIAPCAFYQAATDAPGAAVAEWARATAPTAEEMAAECARKGVCPYIVNRRLLAEAEVVAAPYVYFLDPVLRRAFMAWCAAGPSDFVVVVDEAHNVPDFARSLASSDLGEGTLALARREADEFGNVAVLDGTLIEFLDTLGRVIGELADTYVAEGEEDALVPHEEVDAALIHAFRCATPRLEKAIQALGEYGASVRESRRRAGRVPRSYVGAVAGFLSAWRRADESTHVRLVRMEARADRVEAEPRLECYAVDPSVVTEVFRETAGSLHMSGTLAPLEEYRDAVGLAPEETALAAFPSPFPPEHRLTLFDADVTTRHEDVARDPRGAWDAIARRVREVREALPGRNVAVFLPSYEALHRLAPHVKGAVLETRGATQERTMADLDRFKAARGGTLLSVMGGKLSEGLDFPDDELEVVIVVGLPYPKPTARQGALVRFYDHRFGRGFDYAVRAPMTRRLLQAVGRLIRTPTDRGVVVLLDKRAALLREEMPTLRASRDAAGEARAFFAERPGAKPGGEFGESDS